jgi:hypothetical protein
VILISSINLYKKEESPPKAFTTEGGRDKKESTESILCTLYTVGRLSNTASSRLLFIVLGLRNDVPVMRGANVKDV